MTPPSFSIPNARLVRLVQRPKVSYLTLLAASDRQGMTTYFDVVCFATNGLAIPAEGASVSVTGTLGRRKPQTGRDWTTELVARAIEAGDEGSTPVVPVRGFTYPDTSKPPVPAYSVDRSSGAAADLKASEDDNIPF